MISPQILNDGDGQAPEATRPVGSDETRRNTRTLSRATLLAFIFLAIFNAGALERYVANFAGSTAIEEVLYQVGQWNTLMTDLGLGEPREFARETVDGFRALRFDE